MALDGWRRFWKETRTGIPLVTECSAPVSLLGSRYLAAGRLERRLGMEKRLVLLYPRGEGLVVCGVLAPETREYRGNELCRITGLFVLSSSHLARDKSVGRFSRRIHTEYRILRFSPFLFSSVA